MILDTGICTIFKKVNTAEAGNMPAFAYAYKYQSWYGELDFATSPAVPTDDRIDVETSARFRITQDRAVTNHDVLVVGTFDNYPESEAGMLDVYEITRAFHGVDSDNGQPVTDLTLRRYQDDMGQA